MKYLIATPLIATAIVALALYARPQADGADLVTLVTTVAVAAGAIHLIRKQERAAINTDAWRQRAHYHAIVGATGATYAHAIAMDYTARDARAHVRAYINAHYAGLNKCERAQVLKDAIEYGKQYPRVPATDPAPQS